MKRNLLLLAAGFSVASGTVAMSSVHSTVAGASLLATGSFQGLTKCPKCGKKTQITWKFCDKCGAKLYKAPVKTTGGSTGATTGGSSSSTVANIHGGHAPMSSRGPAVPVDSLLGQALTSGAEVARALAVNFDGSLVMYGSNAGATTDIFSVPTGKGITTPTRMTEDTAGAEFDPDFGPLGRRIVYVSEGAKGGSSIQIRDMVRGEVRTMHMESGIIWQPRLSPEGRKVVFVRKDSDRSQGDLYLLDLETQDLKQLTEGPANDEYPCWDPAGCHIAFESDRSGSQQIWSLSPTTKAVQQISKGSFPHRRPAWSKRGYIIYESNFTLKVMNENGVEGTLGSGTPIAGSLPKVSADGSALVFERRQNLGVEAFIIRLK